MPDAQVSSNIDTRDYLDIPETANRSRLAVKTIYNWKPWPTRTTRRRLSRRAQGRDSLAHL